MRKVHKKKLRQAISSILAAAMSLSLFTTIPVSADIGRTTYNYDGYSVDYNITNEWDGAQTVELTVSNTGTDSILNWALKYDAEGEISNLWNADLYEQNGDEYVIKNVGWNFEIAPSQSVTYGYTLSGGNLYLPKSFEIYSKRVDKTAGYDVQYNITKSWDTGVEGNIVITNTSAAPIEAWTLSFDSSFTVGNLWDGRVLENNGTSYTIAAEMWTNPVQPNSSMTIGFVGSKAADVEAVLNNFRLTEVVIGEGMPVIPIDPPVEEIEITANAVYDKENGNITVSWASNKQEGTFDILVSDDGENFVSVGTVEGISEFVYTPEDDFETLYFKVIQTTDSKSAESNVVNVANSTDDFEISANAIFDKGSGNITVSWLTTKDNGSFEIFVSEDDDNFTSLGTVENTKEFIYTPDREFEILYFKVKQTVDTEFAESESVMAYYPIDLEDETDTDNDGLTDVYEKYYFETDPTNPDTDGDGLPDGYEVYLGTDPTKADTDDNGISDSDEDFDNDGLSNLRECELGTDPYSEDSDSDGITDGEEVNKYNTDPIDVDTDGDGVSDKDEIDLGFDPTSTSTDGIPDNERTFEQSVGADTENFASVNTDENPFKVSVDVTAAGVAENNLYADESGYSAFVSNEAILGITPEFFYNDKLKVEKITINFDISSEYVANTNGKYVSVSDEFVGIKRFNVFKYFDDVNMLLPIETFHDVANNRVYANVDEMGTYCLIDMEIWFEKLGVEPKSAEPQAIALSEDETSELKVSNDDNLDVVFVLYSSSSYIKHMKSELITTAEEIFKEAEERNVSARIHYLTWTGDVYLNTATGEYFAENLEDATAMINRSVVIDTTTLYPSDYVLTKAISGIKNTVCGNLQENSKKYSFIVDAGCNPTCTTIHYGIQALQEQGFDFSFIYAPGNHNIANYNALSSNNSCYEFKLMPGRMMFSDFVIEHIFAEEEEIIIKSNDFERLPDDFGEISNTSTQDYDGDGLLDVDEINWELSETFSFEAYSNYSTRSTASPLISYPLLLKRISEESPIDKYDFTLEELSVLPVYSDLNAQDTDNDGFSDLYESRYSDFMDIGKHDDTIVNDETLDDTGVFSGKEIIPDCWYHDCPEIKAEKIEVRHNETNFDEETGIKTTKNVYDYSKYALKYKRNGNSNAKYTIEPNDDSDYILTLTGTDILSAAIKIEEKTIDLSSVGGKEYYKDISSDNKKVKFVPKTDNQYFEANLILKKGKKYRISVLGIHDDDYTLTVEQDNWVHAPKGAAVQMISGIDEYYLFYYTSDMIKDIVKDNSSQNDYFVVWDDNDTYENNMGNRDMIKGLGYFTNNHLYKQLKESQININILNNANTIVFGVDSVTFALIGKHLFPAIFFGSKGAPALSATFGIICMITNEISAKKEAFIMEKFDDSFMDGKGNIVYHFNISADSTHGHRRNVTWTPWNPNHYINKYIESGDYFGVIELGPKSWYTRRYTGIILDFDYEEKTISELI